MILSRVSLISIETSHQCKFYTHIDWAKPWVEYWQTLIIWYMHGIFNSYPPGQKGAITQMIYSDAFLWTKILYFE